jgi:hypothetical protein
MGSAREIAVDLMERLLSGELIVSDFCAQYEQHFNFDWPDRGVEAQAELFGKLFEVVVWYSPYPDERKIIPNYTGEADVIGLVQSIRSQVAA